jgi:double-strand break repair protein MRE11
VIIATQLLKSIQEPAKKKAAANDGDSDDSMAMDIDYGVKGLDGGFDDDDDEEDEAPKKKPAAKSKTTAAKGKAKAAPAASKTAAKGKGTAKKPLVTKIDLHML